VTAVLPTTIGDSDVQVWIARFSAGRLDLALRGALAAELDDVTLTRVDRYRTAEDRDRGLAAHALLRRLLGSVVGERPSRLRIATWCAEHRTAEHGKPYLSGWGDQPPVQFNLSHSGDLVAVALAGPGQQIGVDVESLSRPVNWQTLRRSVFSDHEWHQTGASAAPAHARAQAWSRKEACVKATGRGLATPLRSVLLSSGPGAATDQPGSWRARIEANTGGSSTEDGSGTEAGTATELAGWDIAAAAGVDDGYAAAVAIRAALDVVPEAPLVRIATL
jgi:4'-phosphopantetheinyl transferase